MCMCMCTVSLGTLPCWQKVDLVLYPPTIIGHVAFLVQENECWVSKLIEGIGMEWTALV